MSAYRFCRSDDVPLLVRAHNECYAVHFADRPDLDVEGFKRAVRELDLWTSSCMVAFAGQEPIAVLLAGKRRTENLIYRVGVRPDHLRQGHGRHIVASLSSKLAILGPRRIVAEVPCEADEPRAFLQACGLRHERDLVDFVLEPTGEAVPDHPLITPITLDELLAQGAFAAGPRCWERAPEGLIKRKARIDGLAVASDERIEAYLLYHDPDPAGTREIVAFGCARPERSSALLGTLVRLCSGREGRSLRWGRVAPQEASSGLLTRLGFRPGGRTAVYAMEARQA